MKLEPVTPEPVTPEPVTAECPRAVERPIMLQGWHDLASVHWPYNPEVVQRLLPKGVQVDTCNGSAWVGLIPFHMRRIRLPGWPSFGRWSTFARVPVWADVEHPPWVIHRSSLLSCEDTLLTATGLPSPSAEPVVLWSPGVEVRIGRPRRLSSLRQQ